MADDGISAETLEAARRMGAWLGGNTPPVRRELGHVNVTSGQLFVVDPAYLDTWLAGDYSPGRPADNSYARVSEVTTGDDRGGEIEQGVAAGVPLGDGMYPVQYVEDDRGHRLEIIFLDHEEGEDSEGDGF